MKRLLIPLLFSTLGFVSTSVGDFNRTTGLIDIPTAEWMERNLVRVITNTTFALGEDEYPAYLDFGLGYGFLGMGEVVLNVYTSRDYSAHLAFKLRDEKNWVPAIGLGVQELTSSKWISSVGRGDTVGFPDDVAYIGDWGRPSERFSTYLVATKNFYPFGSYTLGVGRGRFVGYGPHSRQFNTDHFRQEDEDGPPHEISELAFGLFAGTRWELFPGFSLILEFDGRDVNAGMRYEHQYFTFGLAGTHLDQIGGKPHLNPRIALGLSANNSWMYALPNEGMLVCRVVEAETGRPLQATISFPDMEIPSLQTSSKGAFKLKLPVGHYVVLAGKDGYAWKESRISIARGRMVECDFALEPESPPEEGQGLIVCRVVDAMSDAPLLATISFPGLEIPPLKTARDGTFKLKFPVGTHTVEASRDGYHSDQMKVTVPEGRPVACNFALEPASLPKAADRDSLIGMYIERGLAYFAADSLFEAAAQWSKVLNIDPDHEKAKTLLARVREIIRDDLVSRRRQKALEYAAKGELSKALEEWQAILNLDSENAQAKKEIARIKAKLGPSPPRWRVDELFREGLSLFLEEQYEKALEVFNRVIAMQPAHKGAIEYRDKARARLKAIRGR